MFLFVVRKNIYELETVPRNTKPIRYSRRYNISDLKDMIVHFIEYNYEDEHYYVICIMNGSSVKKLAIISKNEFGSADLYHNLGKDRNGGYAEEPPKVTNLIKSSFRA